MKHLSTFVSVLVLFVIITPQTNAYTTTATGPSYNRISMEPYVKPLLTGSKYIQAFGHATVELQDAVTTFSQSDCGLLGTILPNVTVNITNRISGAIGFDTSMFTTTNAGGLEYRTNPENSSIEQFLTKSKYVYFAPDKKADVISTNSSSSSSNSNTAYPNSAFIFEENGYLLKSPVVDGQTDAYGYYSSWVDLCQRNNSASSSSSSDSSNSSSSYSSSSYSSSSSSSYSSSSYSSSSSSSYSSSSYSSSSSSSYSSSSYSSSSSSSSSY